MKVYVSHYDDAGESVLVPVSVEDDTCPLDALIQEILNDPFFPSDATICSAKGYVLARVFRRSRLVEFTPYYFYLPRCSSRMKAVKRWCICNNRRIETICESKWQAKRLLSDKKSLSSDYLTLELIRFYQ